MESTTGASAAVAAEPLKPSPADPTSSSPEQGVQFWASEPSSSALSSGSSSSSTTSPLASSSASAASSSSSHFENACSGEAAGPPARPHRGTAHPHASCPREAVRAPAAPTAAPHLSFARTHSLCPPSPSASTARSKHTAIVWEGLMVAFGGHDVHDETFLNDLLIYDIEARRWRTPAVNTTAGPCARRAHTADLVGDYMVVCGGFSGEDCLNDVYALHLPSLEWRAMKVSGGSSDAPCNRGGHSSAVRGGEVYIFGGWDTSMTYHNDLWRLQLDFKQGICSWVEEKPVRGVSPQGRVGHRSVMHGDEFLVFGGYGDTYWSDTHAFNVVTKAWRGIAAAPGQVVPEPRTYHNLLEKDGKLLLIGGSDETTMMDGAWVLDLAEETWRHIPCPGTANFAHTCVKGSGTSLLVFGGTSHDVSDLAELVIEDWCADNSLVHYMNRFMAFHKLYSRQHLQAMPRGVAAAYLKYLTTLSIGAPMTDRIQNLTSVSGCVSTPHRKTFSASALSTPESGPL